MKRQIVASVLLASMIFAVPVYAGQGLSSEESDSYDQYKSPLEQSYGPIVNDHPKKAKTDDDGEAFARAAGLLTQGAASGKDVSGRQAGKKELRAAPEQDAAPVNENENIKKTKQDAVAAEKEAALEKAGQQAEKVLSETDENFEPVQEKVYPGQEYQARRQIKSETRAPLGKAVTSAPLNAAVNNPKKKQDTKKLPLIIKGNDAQYASESGDFIIEGNVSLEQGLTKMYSSKAVGNEKTGDIWLLEGGTLKEQNNTVYARWIHYNYNKETGELRHINGASQAREKSNKFDYYEAPHGLIENGMMIMDQGGMTTRCPAVRHPSCLSIKAKTIAIIPNDRIIARNVQVFVKGKHIYSRDVWINDLQKKSSQINPSVGWEDDKGWYLKVDYRRPIGNPLLKNPTEFYMKQVYYTKSKYKPYYSIRHDEYDFYAKLDSGYIYDSDNDQLDEGVWLRKKIDWGLFLKRHRITQGLPLSYDGYITHGLWKYSHRNWESWHTEAAVYLRHDRFYPLGGKKLYMDLMLGHKWVRESLDTRETRKYGKNLHTNIYHGTIGYRFSDKWNIWTTYHKENKTSYLFSKDQPSFTNDLQLGIAWTPDKQNTLRIVNRRNLDSDSTTRGNYTTTFTWSHRFCCEVITFQYQKKHYNRKNEWTVELDLLNW